jgi:importin subunit beta-1
VRLAGVVALNNSLSFTSENFSKANERDVIMRTVCESTQCTDVKVREKAFECIARISDLYYDMLQPYVDTLFQLTTTAIRTDDPLGINFDDAIL